MTQDSVNVEFRPVRVWRPCVYRLLLASSFPDLPKIENRSILEKVLAAPCDSVGN